MTRSGIFNSAVPSQARNLVRALILALAVRWAYAAVLYVFMGDNGLMSGDSYGYFANAQAMATKALAGELQGWDWLGVDLARMPLYPWLVTANVAVFGRLAAISTVLMQGVVDTGTCFLVYRIASSIDQRIALPAAVCAALNPTMIVLSGLILTDTIFVFFVALVLYGALRWMQGPSWTFTLMIGIGLGLAAMDRVLIALFFPVLVIVLLATRQLVARIQIINMCQIGVAAVILCSGLAPVLARNVTQYDAWALTPQGGAHLALWIGPLVREAKDGTPWAKGSADAEARTIARFGGQSSNPFVNARRYTKIGKEQLAELGLTAIVKAWVMGATINLASPALIISPPIAGLPRTGFYQTEGDTVLNKIYNFLFHSDNAIYALVLLVGIVGVGLFRLVQVIGFFALIREPGTWPALILLTLWIGFILAANGPIASPKYRLPIEPALCVLAGAGIQRLRRRT
jgi:4-amino-4-deoxy-L-arabinose transferase-like glycosyltransferase